MLNYFKLLKIKNTSNKNLYNRNSSINKTESYTDYELLNKTEKFIKVKEKMKFYRLKICKKKEKMIIK